MPAYSHKELPYARPIANAILNSGDFRRWLLAGTTHERDAAQARPIGEAEQRRLRHLKKENPHWWFNYFCGKDAKCSCRIGTGIETDILIILNIYDDRRLCLHIEVKRPGDHLGDGQGESYSRRAACWANSNTRPKTVPFHHEFMTILVCGRELEYDNRLSWFDKVLFHEDVARQIQNYPDSR